MTQCECSQSGWCSRHQCQKNDHWRHLCQTREDYFELWERGCGPGQEEQVRLPSIAVVVISHNYGRFLGEALDSVLLQTHPVNEILVVDDQSEDDTRAVAESYSDRGVRYLYVAAGNVHQARRAGFENTRAEVLCFLDADDRLSADYVETGLREFADYRVAVVYSDVEYFGHQGGRSTYPSQYDSGQLQYDNYMHAGSLVRREALRQSDAFQHEIDALLTQGDWFLWRHVLTNNWKATKQAALYHCRKHGKNWSFDRRRARPTVNYFEYAALSQEEVTLFLPLAGRHAWWPQLSAYLERQTWPHAQIRLILLDTSQDAEFSATVRQWIAHCDYSDVRHVCWSIDRPGAAVAEADRRVTEVREQVTGAMPRIYNKMIELVETEYVWILEDDVLPPDDVCKRLLQGFDTETASVAAPYRSRYRDGYVVWRRNGMAYTEPGTGLERVAGNGFGCTIVRRSVLQQTVFTAFQDVPDYDRAFYARLQATPLRVKVDWTCRCRHGSDGETACECLSAGWCPRHQCHKSQHWVDLCRTRPEYFQLWEEGRGPGQTHIPPQPGEGPGVLRKAVNFGKAVARHALDGAHKVSESAYQARLAICQSCPACDTSEMVCTEKACGCRLRIKAAWRSEVCPRGKWPLIAQSSADSPQPEAPHDSS